MKSRLKGSLIYHFCRKPAEDPVHGEAGQESKWLFWEDWEIAGQALLLCDVSLWGSSEDVIRVELPPGR